MDWVSLPSCQGYDSCITFTVRATKKAHWGNARGSDTAWSSQTSSSATSSVFTAVRALCYPFATPTNHIPRTLLPRLKEPSSWAKKGSPPLSATGRAVAHNIFF